MKKILSSLLPLALATTSFAQGPLDSISQRIEQQEVSEKNLDALYMESLFKTEVLLAIQRTEAINQRLGINSDTNNFIILSSAAVAAATSIIATKTAISAINTLTPSTSKAPWKNEYRTLKRQQIAALKAAEALKPADNLSSRLAREPFFGPQALDEVMLADTNLVRVDQQLSDEAAARFAARTAEGNADAIRLATQDFTQEANQQIHRITESFQQRINQLEAEGAILRSEKEAAMKYVRAQAEATKATHALNAHLAKEPSLARSLVRGSRHMAKVGVLVAGVATVAWIIGDTVMLQMPEDTERLKINLKQELNEINTILTANDVDLKRAIEIAYERINQ